MYKTASIILVLLVGCSQPTTYTQENPLPVTIQQPKADPERVEAIQRLMQAKKELRETQNEIERQKLKMRRYR